MLDVFLSALTVLQPLGWVEPPVRVPPGRERGYRLYAPSPAPKVGDARPVVLLTDWSAAGPEAEALFWELRPRLSAAGMYVIRPVPGRGEPDAGALRDLLRDVAGRDKSVDADRLVMMGVGPSAAGWIFQRWGRGDFGLAGAGRVVGVLSVGAAPLRGGPEPAIVLPAADHKDRLSVLLIADRPDRTPVTYRAAQEALSAGGFAVRLIEPDAAAGWPAAAVEWIAGLAAAKPAPAAPARLSEPVRKAAEAHAEKLAAAAGQPAVPHVPGRPLWSDEAAGLSMQMPAGWTKADAGGDDSAAWAAPEGGPRRLRIVVRGTADPDGWEHLWTARRAAFAVAGVRYEMIALHEMLTADRPTRVLCEHVVRPDAAGGPDLPLLVLSFWVAADAKATKWLRFAMEIPSGLEAKEIDAAVSEFAGLVRTLRAGPAK
jgi:hypothetical protein